MPAPLLPSILQRKQLPDSTVPQKGAVCTYSESVSFTEMDNLGTSTLITRMTSDINQVQSGVNLVLRLFLRSPFIVFGAMVMAFYGGCEGGNDLCCSYPDAFGGRIWHYDLDHAAVSAGAGSP